MGLLESWIFSLHYVCRGRSPDDLFWSLLASFYSSFFLSFFGM
uniref:Uncharacterized protein n=1 Tax=Arundo donax TaxID=35708 RepID=A0A0A9FNC8_ARUDO